MFPDAFKESLVNCVATALERMAFMVGDPVDKELPDSSLASCISLSVDGVDYRVCVRATGGAMQELLSGLLGSDTFEQLEAQLATDELVNVLGGEVLRLLGGDTQPSSLGLPEPGVILGEHPAKVHCTLEFTGETIEVAVMAEEPTR